MNAEILDSKVDEAWKPEVEETREQVIERLITEVQEFRQNFRQYVSSKAIMEHSQDLVRIESGIRLNGLIIGPDMGDRFQKVLVSILRRNNLLQEPELGNIENFLGALAEKLNEIKAGGNRGQAVAAGK